jgi:hypothetical protein
MQDSGIAIYVFGFHTSRTVKQLVTKGSLTG